MNAPRRAMPVEASERVDIALTRARIWTSDLRRYGGRRTRSPKVPAHLPGRELGGER
jgi:hypothetical protein